MLVFNYDHLYTVAETTNVRFAQARPFPHVVIDDFLPPEAYASVRDCFPGPTDDIWKKPDNIHTRGKMVTKRGADDLKERQYSQEARRVFHEFNSSLFLRFLETLTGIKGLIGDPYFAEGGFHSSEDGGYLDVHADFSHHDLLGLERRLNLIMYLNDDWEETYGGALTLFDTDINPVSSVVPVGNRCLIFETSATSFHGHPEAMKLAPGVYRRSIALYYYSVPTGREKSRIVFPADPEFVHKITTD